MNAKDSGQAGAIEITPQLIEDAYLVLCSSGITGTYLEADKEGLRDIFHAMFLERTRASRSPHSGH